MPRFLALYHGAAGEPAKPELSDEERSAFLDAWGTWARTHAAALVDPGAPLFRKKRVTADGVEDFEDSRTGYAIIEAGSHDEAADIFSTHPHLRLFPGNAIEVLECPTPPA